MSRVLLGSAVEISLTVYVQTLAVALGVTVLRATRQTELQRDALLKVSIAYTVSE